MSSDKPSLLSRRAALAAVFAVGLHCALAGRARADTPVEAAAPVEWSSLSVEERQALGRYGDRWSTLAPEQQAWLSPAGDHQSGAALSVAARPAAPVLPPPSPGPAGPAHPR